MFLLQLILPDRFKKIYGLHLKKVQDPKTIVPQVLIKDR